MYKEVIEKLITSNIGSLVKEDILNNNLIKKDKENEYYETISNIIDERDINFLERERKLVTFIINN